jgi:hypothetical protein
MTLDPRWRVTVSLNDNPDRLSMLPPLDDGDISDKVVLLRVYGVTRPTSDEESAEWVAALRSELPALIHHCLSLQVPEHLKEPGGIRFGFRAFKNASLMGDINECEREAGALALIDQLLFGGADDDQTIQAKPHQIRTMLFDKAAADPIATRELQRLCPDEARLGALLTRIKIRHPERVERPNRTGARRLWRIHPPPPEAEQDVAPPAPSSDDESES